MTSRSEEGPNNESPCPFRGVDNFAVRARMPAMMPRRVREVKRRVVEGYYDRPEVVAETARRILASGDLPQDGE